MPIYPVFPANFSLQTGKVTYSHPNSIAVVEPGAKDGRFFDAFVFVNGTKVQMSRDLYDGYLQRNIYGKDRIRLHIRDFVTAKQHDIFVPIKNIILNDSWANYSLSLPANVFDTYFDLILENLRAHDSRLCYIP